MRPKLYFVLALIFALLASGSVYLYLESLKQEVKKDLDYTLVPVASRDIPARTVVTAGMVEQKEVPLSQLHQEAHQDDQGVIGSTTSTPIFTGEQFLQQKLVGTGDTTEGLSYIISPGKRAMSIAVNEVSGVGRMVLPGDQVDVIAVLDLREETDRVTYATLLVQRVKVLAVGRVLEAGTPYLEACTVTLEVTPEEAQRLALGADKGSIRLLLRQPADQDTIIQLPPILLQEVLGDGYQPAGPTGIGPGPGYPASPTPGGDPLDEGEREGEGEDCPGPLITAGQEAAR